MKNYLNAELANVIWLVECGKLRAGYGFGQAFSLVKLSVKDLGYKRRSYRCIGLQGGERDGKIKGEMLTLLILFN